MMAEIPAALVLIDEFLDMGVSNVTVGLNDLSGLVLGAHRGKDIDRTNPAVVRLVRDAVKAVHRRGLEISIGGYIDRHIENIYRTTGADYLIVHYGDLPEVLGTAREALPHIGLLREIKNLTKARRNEREMNLWRDRLQEVKEPFKEGPKR